MTYSRSIDENLLIYKILWFVSIGSRCSSDRTIGDWSSCLSGPLWFENSRVNQSKGPSLLVRQHLDSLTSARAVCIRNGWSNWKQVASRIENSLRTKWFAWTLRERQVHISLLLRSSESYWWWSITPFILSFTTIIHFDWTLDRPVLTIWAMVLWRLIRTLPCSCVAWRFDDSSRTCPPRRWKNGPIWNT